MKTLSFTQHRPKVKILKKAQQFLLLSIFMGTRTEPGAESQMAVIEEFVAFDQS